MRRSRARRSLPFPFRFRNNLRRVLHDDLGQRFFTFLIFHFLTAIRRFNLKKLMSNDVDCTTPNPFIVERWLRSGLSGALPVGPRLRVPTTAVTYLFTLQSFYFLSRCFDPMLQFVRCCKKCGLPGWVLNTKYFTTLSGSQSGTLIIRGRATNTSHCTY